MTAVGFGRGFPRVWLIPILVMTALLGAAVAGRLSRSIVADLAAWWPAWVALAAVAYYFRDRKLGQVRVAGLVPIVGLGVVVVFGLGHVAGWSLMPSAGQRLVGPELGDTLSASLVAELDGVIEVSRESSPFVYVVGPVRRGGTIGIPGSTEQRQGTALEISFTERGDPGVYSYAGWDLVLGAVEWDLDLTGAIDADLTGHIVRSLDLAGSGVVRLGPPDDTPNLSVGGQFEIVVAPGTAVTVLGVASVPASWTLTDIGAVSPGGDAGWQIRVMPGAKVRVTEG